MSDVDDDKFDRWLRVQEELAQLVAHDMRNPLAAVMANLSFLEQTFETGDPEIRETLADIRLSSEMLLRLIENTVAVARLESPDAVMIPRVSVDLAAVAQQAVERCLATAQTSSVGLALAPPRGAAHAAGDTGLFELMAQNMVANAITHSRRRQQVVVRAEAEGERAVLVVEDEGPPFRVDAQDFTRDAQPKLKLETDARYSRGLALYVVGLVTRAFDGTIATARSGNRTTTRLSFPSAT